MMRFVIWLLLLASAAVSMSLAARYNDGYALLVLPPWRMELSLNFLLIVLLAAFFVGYWLLLMVRHLVHLPSSVANYRQRRAVMRSADSLQEAYRFLSEGRYGHALRTLEQNYAGHPQAGMVALLGWRASHALRDPERIALWHSRVLAAGAEFDAARLITEAELALADRSFAEAQQALQTHSRQGRLHIAALRLQLRAEQGLGNWREVARLARQLEKHRGLTPDQAAPICERARREVLQELRKDLPALRRYWSELDATERTRPALAHIAARALISGGANREAQTVIEDALEQNWDSELIAAYADCHGGDVTSRLARAEKWLQLHPRDAALLLVLGRLCIEQQLWGKARSFIEASLSLRASRATHLELARLLDRLEESALAARHYRSAALL